MKTFFFLFVLLSSQSLFAQCDELVQQARRGSGRPVLMINFDGLGTNEFGMKVLRRHISQEIVSRCGRKNIVVQDYHYGRGGVSSAMSCIRQFDSSFAQGFSLHLFGHSFGAGIGVMNLLDELQGGRTHVENAVTFDPRGNGYSYANPGSQTVKNFINIYQRRPLAGRPVRGANFERDVTGQSSHVALPRNLSAMALAQLKGDLTCAR